MSNSTQTDTTGPQQPNVHASVIESSDREETKERFVNAVTCLQQAIRWWKDDDEASLQHQELEGEPEGFDLQFREKLNKVLDSRRETIKDRSILSKCGDTMVGIFTALSPFAKSFLTIAKEDTGAKSLWINLWGSSSAFVEKEVERRSDITKALEYIRNQVGQLDVVGKIPLDIQGRDSIVNRAMDARSACMMYLATHLKHEANRLGLIGRIITTSIGGDNQLTEAHANLKSALDTYNAAVGNITLRVVVKVYEILRESTDFRVHAPTGAIENTFMVPYERNIHFSGRDYFLQTLEQAVTRIEPGRNNHRVALYGMGGIGKTQIALEYVYSRRRAIYRRIYWLTGIDQTALLSDYQKIAKNVPLATHGLTPMQTAEAVLVWLRHENDWLLVIDNLDDIKVAKGLLPENGPGKHLMITTRNPNADGIPAEGLEVPLLSLDDSKNLLLNLSKVDPLPSETNLITKIVEELGCLPLAIEQAASYVQQVTGDFTSFHEEYQKNRGDVLKWVPESNQPYSRSIATTWSMSFRVLNRNFPSSAKLLQLLSFLNPDGVLVEFLKDGVECLDMTLKQVLSNQVELAKALLKLERLSLVKRNRFADTIVIHRLVQVIVRDQMSRRDHAAYVKATINLCRKAFPSSVVNETRSRCRLYQSQIMEPLNLTVTLSPLNEISVVKPNRRLSRISRLLFRVRNREIYMLKQNYADICDRLAYFLMQDGKFVDSETLCRRVINFRIEISGRNHPGTLDSMEYLAAVYGYLGRPAEELELHKEVWANRKRVLGKNHRSTLYSMHNVALAYKHLGRTSESAELFENTLVIMKRIIGEDDPDTLIVINNLAGAYKRLGRLIEAIELREEVLAKSKRILSEDHPNTLLCMHALAKTYNKSGRHTEAAELLEEAIAKRKRILGEDHPDTLSSMHNLARVYEDLERQGEAAELIKEVLAKRKRSLGKDHPDTLQAMTTHSRIHKTLQNENDVVHLSGVEEK